MLSVLLRRRFPLPSVFADHRRLTFINYVAHDPKARTASPFRAFFFMGRRRLINVRG